MSYQNFSISIGCNVRFDGLHLLVDTLLLLHEKVDATPEDDALDDSLEWT